MRRIGLYSLIAFVSLALVGVISAGVGAALNNDEESAVTQANTPTVAAPEAPRTAPEETEETEEETKEESSDDEEQAEREASEQEAAEQEAEEQEAEEQEAAAQAAQDQRWREIAEERDAEERAAEEQAAAEQEAAEQEAQPTIPTDTSLSLSAPTAGIQSDPVTDSVSESVLADGAGKLPSTGFPWQPGSNTYIAAHVYGYPGTGSWQQFAQVPNMSMGDPIYLTDSGGTTYEYQVSEIVTVAPTDVWVANSTGQDMVSLQTCVGPNWSERLVVRGSLVETSQA